MQERYHALDSMRATMMLMGIYLHVVVGYSGNGHWPYIDANPTPVLDWSLGLIHAFRMPAFFAMAGFFGALLWERRGSASFAANRGKRIVVPFVLFWSLLFPLIAAITISLDRGPEHIATVVRSGELVKRLHPLHLWFLEYLILLYGIGAAAASLPRWNGLHRAFRWALQKPYAPVVFAAFSLLPLTAMRGNLKDPSGFRPEWLILSAYVVPFAFGWLLYGNRDLLPQFERHIWDLIPAFFAFLVYGTTSPREALLKAAGNVLLCWFLTFAVLGLFLRYANRPSARWRYLSDSSYWLFIMHMPVVVGFQVAFRDVPLPALAKVPIVLALSAGVLLVSYDLLVRPTWIGALLNGRRYTRGLPAQREEALRAA
jgi:surface polysaccharide O-acyltransferase-like enzyme